MSTCRSCFQEIWWAETEQGKRMPVDVEPVPDGNVVVLRDGVGMAPPVVRVLPAGQAAIGFEGEALTYTSHFATCPQADQHRRPR